MEPHQIKPNKRHQTKRPLSFLPLELKVPLSPAVKNSNTNNKPKKPFSLSNGSYHLINFSRSFSQSIQSPQIFLQIQSEKKNHKPISKN